MTFFYPFDTSQIRLGDWGDEDFWALSPFSGGGQRGRSARPAQQRQATALIKPKMDWNLLTISGSLLTEKTTQKDASHLVCERRYGALSRAITVPAGLKEHEIKASMEHGVLKIEFPKEANKRQLLNYISNGRLLPYPDQLEGYPVPARYLKPSPALPGQEQQAKSSPQSRADTLVNDSASELAAGGDSAATAPTELDLEKGKMEVREGAEATPYPYLVDWEVNDPEHPLNWPKGSRVSVIVLICYLSFSMYVGSAIYTSSIPDVMASFGSPMSSLPWDYQLFLAPLQELPYLGRNPVYIIGLALFVILQAPCILAPNIATLLVFRFLAGFIGSPALATGAASIMDISHPLDHPVTVGIWSMAAVCSPTLGPILGGFAAQAKGWKWPLYELLWLTGAGLIVLTVLLPETYPDTILLRRAERLRKLTGNELLRTQAELDAEEQTSVLHTITETFFRAFQLCAEPAVAFSDCYTALVYSLLYLWFEAFPLVYGEVYGFGRGISGLFFLSFLVAAIPTFAYYYYYQVYLFQPRVRDDPHFQEEHRLEMALVSSFCIPVSLLIFGWTARPSVHWIVPTIGAGIYFKGIFDVFQCVLVYIGAGYSRQKASILAGNALFRAITAGVFPLFGVAFYRRLGLGGGCTFLAGLSTLMIPLLYLLMKNGARLRARSKWATFKA
ncbi:major facilitator superfamily domain-containing protein [Leucosporidium creatinivorum]|uniref:Major facilitator superfamily domain-containing protein n=1 Tax=Leucosporidium creatinivorum TaxID=106004 RepID=A0A1Y2ENW0_9BASI|nr:major facilitator superfamily domain-containing protein [Leucosporidium creatinivorum]